MVYGIQGMVASAIADKAIKSCNLPNSISSLLCDDDDYANDDLFGCRSM